MVYETFDSDLSLDEDISLTGKRGSRSHPIGPGLPSWDDLSEVAFRFQSFFVEFINTQPRTACALLVIFVVGLWYHGASEGPRLLKGSVFAGGLRGLENGAELKWAEDTFGVYLQKAVPALEKANFDCHNFLSLLVKGDCDNWAGVFAEKGVFSFNVPPLQAEFSGREDVRNAFCRAMYQRIRAIRLVWHFPDVERLSGMALFEVFTQAGPGEEVKKERWAQLAYLDLKNGPHITEYRLYIESSDEGNLQSAVDSLVKANVRRLNGHDCEGFAAALPPGNENWVVQSLPTGSGKKDELDDAPRDQLVAKCRKDTQLDWNSIDFQVGSVEGVFPSARDKEVMIFFHKEKRFKGTLDVFDDPEAIMIKLTGDYPPQVHSLYFFHVEGVHLAQEWSWKYGWASTQAR